MAVTSVASQQPAATSRQMNNSSHRVGGEADVEIEAASCLSEVGGLKQFNIRMMALRINHIPKPPPLVNLRKYREEKIFVDQILAVCSPNNIIKFPLGGRGANLTSKLCHVSQVVSRVRRVTRHGPRGATRADNAATYQLARNWWLFSFAPQPSSVVIIAAHCTPSEH